MIVACSGTSRLAAHPGGHGNQPNDPKASRTWTLAESGLHLHGTFITAKDGKAHIRRDDGKLSVLTIDELIPADQRWVAQRQAEIKRLNEQSASPNPAPAAAPESKSPPASAKAAEGAAAAPAILQHFKPYEKSLELRWDEKYLFVGSNGLPDHRLMVGITAWQQQVPLPQKYFGDNAWRIPLHPVPAKEPMTTKGKFLRGAIALAVNGIPIFNPLNNRGDDAYLFGELDEYGGHCGRADDYHYHIAPVHLEKTVGKDQPIAYALDGYPIYGYQDEKSPDYAPLDWMNGHKDKDGKYHYHATKKYPYLNGGFYGAVNEKDGQVDPQPRAEPLRPALPPLRDAKIVDFAETGADSYKLTYDVKRRKGTVSYTLKADGGAQFTFVDVDGKTRTETYRAKSRGPEGSRLPRPEDRPPPRGEDRRPVQQKPVTKITSRAKLTVASASVDNKGRLSVNCTCDGKGLSPAVAWQGAPEGTKSFAISLWHTAPDQEKSYWVVYNIPAKVTELPGDAKGIGRVGLNDKRRAEFDPMCSKGPGLKTYHLTVYALSSELKTPADKLNRAALLAEVQELTLAEGTLDFQYERKK
jgi:phosphatidylethanolamine-binding protein (PEBP) family uncharacterized protein